MSLRRDQLLLVAETNGPANHNSGHASPCANSRSCVYTFPQPTMPARTSDTYDKLHSSVGRLKDPGGRNSLFSGQTSIA